MEQLPAAPSSGESHPIFRGVCFTTIPSTTFSETEIQRVIKDLTDNGAEQVPMDEETGRVAGIDRAEDEGVHQSHVISTTSDFPDYDQCLENFIHVVRPSWVENCIAKNKITNPRQYSPDPALIFSEVLVTCADVPQGDQEAIYGGVLALGGQYTHAMSKLVTHVVALTMDHPKCEVAVRKKLKCSIVLPHWFQDSLSIGRKIPEGPYVLPDPDVLSKRHDKPPSHPESVNEIRGASTERPRELLSPMQSPQQPRKLDVFKGKRIMLSADNNIGQEMVNTITTLVRNGGGQTVYSSKDADTLICHYRDGPDYVHAVQKEKDIGNLNWMYDLIRTNRWTNPLRKLLHFPYPRAGILGFKGLKISVSNYSGDARVYLETLIKAAGAEFTKTMANENTHLITSHTQSEKCDAAKEWGIKIINHLWLEESYARCKIRNDDDPKYTYFPPGTHLANVLGGVHLDGEAIRESLKGNRGNLSMRDREILNLPLDRSNGVLRPDRRKSGRVADPIIEAPPEPEPGDSSFVQEPDQNFTDAPYTSPTPATSRKAKRSRTENTVRTPAVSKFLLGKENETPSTTGSRDAKEKALSKLHDSAADIAKYEKERKRVGGVTHGRERPTSRDGESKSKKRKSEGAEESEPEASEVEAPRKAKRAKSGGKVPIIHRMVVTKYERWDGNLNLEHAERAKLRNMGILVTDTLADITILCAPKIVRTQKFVSALAAGPLVVDPSFIDKCLKTGELPSEYHTLQSRLTDPENEETYGFRLSKAIDRAKWNKHHLLKGWQIFCTEGVPGGFDTYKAIIATNGGMCQLYKGRTNLTVSKRMTTLDTQEVANQGTEDDGDTLYLISGCNKNEVAQWRNFRKMARAADMVPRIVKNEWILTVALSQEIIWEPKWELDEDNVTHP